MIIWNKIGTFWITRQVLMCSYVPFPIFKNKFFNGWNHQKSISRNNIFINKLRNLIIIDSFKKIRNGQVVENIFPEKMICDLLKSHHSFEFGAKRWEQIHFRQFFNKNKYFLFLPRKKWLKINNSVFQQNYAKYETIVILFSDNESVALMGIKLKSSAKREYYDENVFLKVDGALSKWNFLLYSKSKKKLVICM